MVRTVITPNKESLELNIPKEYIGRQIEVLIYPVDQLIEQDENKAANMQQFKGSISKELAEKINEEIDKSRKEWSSDGRI